MAKRRMFSTDVILTDHFLEMPKESQLLYFYMVMYADDDGFVANPKSLMRLCGIPEDNYRILLSKGYLIPFESGVIVIRHWKVNNYIQKDRYQPTRYQDELSRLTSVDGVYMLIDVEISRDKIPANSMYPDCIQNGYTDKEREEEERERKKSSFYSVSVSENRIPVIEEVQAYCNEKGYTFNVQKFMQHNQKCNWCYADGTPKDWRTNADQWQSREWNKAKKSSPQPKPKPHAKPSSDSEPYEEEFMKVWSKK